MGGWLGGSVGQWVGSYEITKNLMRFMICRSPPPMGGCVGGWVGQVVNGCVRSKH